jgi:hypothetical protein
MISVAALVMLLHEDYANDDRSFAIQVLIYTGAMFACCMVCHGEMVRRKPAADSLTSFYLYVSLGGAVGGLLVSIIAPLVFDGYWELHLCLIAIAVIAGLCIFTDKNFQPAPSLRWAMSGGWGLATFVLAFYLLEHALVQREGSIANTRGFYGVLHVYEENGGTENQTRSLYHGRITHGIQWNSPFYNNIPTSYYGTNSGVGLAVKRHPFRAKADDNSMKVGIIGLGVGSLAVYARDIDDYRFYEINTQIETLARQHFTYLSDSKSKPEIIIGDGRISLARELNTSGSQQFDVLVVDAFSGDAIPIHLLTAEAVDLYWQHLKPDGILALHITNIYFDLLDVAYQLASHTGHKAVWVEDFTKRRYERYSSWVLITNNQAFLYDKKVLKALDVWAPPVKPVIWTDDFSNLVEVIDW